MSNRTSNYPGGQAAALSGQVVSGEIVADLYALSQRKKPETVDELQRRIDEYFQFCIARDMRPGMEGLSLCCSVSRQTFWKWLHGSRGQEWADVCDQARQQVIAFLEQAGLQGKLNPASLIFLLKNIANYKDTKSFDENTPRTNEDRPYKSGRDLKKLIIDAEEVKVNDSNDF